MIRDGNTRSRGCLATAHGYGRIAAVTIAACPYSTSVRMAWCCERSASGGEEVPPFTLIFGRVM